MNTADFALPTGHGFVMRGWDFGPAEVAVAVRSHRLLNPALELCTNACPWSCPFCFTEDPSNPDGAKRRLRNELPIQRRLELIDEVHRLGARTINVVGAGEPTIDPHFWRIVEAISARGMLPVVYSEASLKLTDPEFVRRLEAVGATVVVKVNSLWNAAWQDQVVQGRLPRSGKGYTERRNAAIQTLLDAGFARCSPTRLAFDTIVCAENLAEIPRLHRWARDRNIFILLVNYLPSGRSSAEMTGAVGRDQQFDLFRELAAVDERHYGLTHAWRFPYGGGVPCTIRGPGLFTKIRGEVLGCPGESVVLGNLKAEPRAAIWARMRRFTADFDGGCPPREAFWAGVRAQQSLRQAAHPKSDD